MRLKLISCEIFEREVNAAIAHSINHIDVQFLDQSQHQLAHPDLVPRLQTVIDRVSRASYHAVLLVSGSCKLGVTGLRAPSIPLVLPRARDCISMVMAPEHQVSNPVPKKGSGPPSLSSWSSRAALFRKISRWTPPSKSRALSKKQAASKGARSMLPTSDLYLGRQRGVCLTRTNGERQRDGPGQAVLSGQEDRWLRRTRSSILEEMVDGYWSHASFLVVPPGWRVVANPNEGTISAEELIP